MRITLTRNWRESSLKLQSSPKPLAIFFIQSCQTLVAPPFEANVARQPLVTEDHSQWHSRKYNMIQPYRNFFSLISICGTCTAQFSVEPKHTCSLKLMYCDETSNSWLVILSSSDLSNTWIPFNHTSYNNCFCELSRVGNNNRPLYNSLVTMHSNYHGF